MSPNYYRDQMCEVKMDQECPETDDHKNSTSGVRVKNGKSYNTNSSSTTGRRNNSGGESPPISPPSSSTISKDIEEYDHHQQHHHHHHPHHHHHHHHLLLHHHHHLEDDPPLSPQSQLEEEDELEDEDMSTDDMISVGGSPSPSLSTQGNEINPRTNHRSRNSIHENNIDEYFRPFKKLRMVKIEPPSSQVGAGVKSFSISDILSHKPIKSPTGLTTNYSSSSSLTTLVTTTRNLEVNNGLMVAQQRIVRPWDPQQHRPHHHHHHHHHHHQSKSNGRRNSSDSSPLDALFQMTSKTFEGLNGHHDGSDLGGHGNANQAFSSRQPPKKKRKSRTAFTNHQIFELEKRFLYQKYLSPADRDDIAQQLGLTNAQVITWFQNRRAKLKRDMEELKKDVESAKLLSAQKSFLESAHELGLLRKRAQSQTDMMNPAAVAAAAAAASFHMSSPTSSSLSSHSPINLTSESPPSTH